MKHNWKPCLYQENGYVGHRLKGFTLRPLEYPRLINSLLLQLALLDH